VVSPPEAQLLEECQEIAALQLSAGDDLAFRINAPGVVASAD
jgi:hypothetical protein